MALVSWVVDFCIAICLQGEGGSGVLDYFHTYRLGHEECQQTWSRQRQVMSGVKDKLLETREEVGFMI